MYCEKCGDKVEKDELYCNNCGNYLGNRTNNNQTINFNNNLKSFNNQMINMNNHNHNNNLTNKNNSINQPEHHEKNEQLKSLALGIIVGAVILIFAGILYMNFFNSNIYLSEETYDTPGEITETQEISTSKYKTVIIYDNQYEGVKATTKKEAHNLISKDSTEQKKTCSSEIIKIENEIIKKYGITAVNLCEMDPAFAKEVGNVFKRIYEEYPGTDEVLTNLTLVNAPMSSGYIAAFQPIFTFATNATESTYPWILKTQIYLNTTYFLNTERLKLSVQNGSASGHFPPNATIYSPVAHEMGHYLSFLAMMKNYNVDSILLIDENDVDALYNLVDDFGNGYFSLQMIKEAYNNAKQEKTTTLAFDDWRATISSYAVAKDNSGKYIYDETIAEAFHDVYLNKDNASSASKYIIAVLKKYLKG